NGIVFIHDLRSNITTSAFTVEESEAQRTQSFTPAPPPGGWAPEFSSISADGSLIAFNSLLDDLVPGDTENVSDIFVVENLLANEEVSNVDPFEPLIGTAEDDVLVDIDGQDSIFGLQGDDSINGGSGADVIFGNQGFDTIDGNINNDTIYGGKDNDSILGNGGNDLLLGERDNDRLLGEDGNDSLFGGKGGDYLNGGTGSDRLSGDLGDDTLAGSKGDNTLIGGIGEDVFQLTVNTGNNIILDFEDGIDRIDLKQELAFSELAIVPGEDNTISIVVTRTEEVIGTITRADEIAIASDDFVEGF
ncbi:MAG: calcium-binding protein, partial [Okeania sp. SIO3C4]|nr:calcium-binding protein [Okeania sp. SIO3C4]